MRSAECGVMTNEEMLEAEKYWCENCCNWDKEQVQMDGCANCKLTGTIAYAQESGKECRFFNVPADNIIVLPCKVGQTVYVPWKWGGNQNIATVKVEEIKIYDSKNNYMFLIDMESDVECFNQTFGGWKIADSIGKTVFLIKEEAEQALKGGAG